MCFGVFRGQDGSTKTATSRESSAGRDGKKARPLMVTKVLLLSVLSVGLWSTQEQILPPGNYVGLGPFWFVHRPPRCIRLLGKVVRRQWRRPSPLGLNARHLYVRRNELGVVRG